MPLRDDAGSGMPAVAHGLVPRWYKEIVLGIAAFFPGAFEAALVVGVPRPSTDPGLSSVLALALGVPGFVLLVHGVRLGRCVGWRDTSGRTQEGYPRNR